MRHATHDLSGSVQSDHSQRMTKSATNLQTVRPIHSPIPGQLMYIFWPCNW